jgi:hypothetical protein
VTNTIVVLLPGTTGSTLINPDQPYEAASPVWPIQVGADLTATLGKGANVSADEAAALALLGNTQLYPGIPRNWATALSFPTGYGSFAHAFNSRGFQITFAQTPMTPPPLAWNSDFAWGLPTSLAGNLLIGAAYDWRQDISVSAQNLRNLLYNIDRLYGNTYQLYLVGHSMGGLVCRAYLEALAGSDSWLSKIKGLITLGTPHLGAPLALTTMIGSWQDLNAILGKLDFPPAIDPNFDTVALNFVNKSFSDSTYELLPPPSVSFIQDGTSGQSYNISNLPQDILSYLESQGLNASDLADAVTFWGTLNPAGSSSLPPYYCAYGIDNTLPTCLGFIYNNTEPPSLTEKDSTNPPATGEGGDWIVPQWSASFQGRSLADTPYAALGVNHLQLPGDSGVQQQVLSWILSATD